MMNPAETVEQARERLEQRDLRGEFLRNLRSQDFVDLYLQEDSDGGRLGLFAALLSSKATATALDSRSWDLRIGSGMPYGSVVRDETGAARVEYSKLGDEDGVEPIVMRQHHSGIRPDQTELSEQFRLFHNLYHDRDTGKYIKIYDDGEEQVVAIVSDDRVRVRMKELRQYLAARGMHCAVFIDSLRMTTHLLNDLGFKDSQGGEEKTADSILGISYGDYGWTAPEKHKSFSLLMGKRLIAPLPLEQSGLPGAFSGQRAFEEYTIKEDENGSPIRHTCDPDQLSDHFGLNPGRPNYLTPVWFKREVLDKYYAQPSKYTVGDGVLKCGGLWLIRIDNHGVGDVMVWLGDLGRDLPESHHAHWLHHNCAPKGTISKVAYRRQILAEFTDSDHPEHVFKQQYVALVEQSNRQNGWPLFLPLAAGDAHHYSGLRVPVRDEQPEFDSQVGSLVKLLVDSLNETKLLELIPPALRRENMKGIDKLELALQRRSVAECARCIRFLRDLQDLRSTGIAHRKGGKYEKAKKSLGVTDRERDKTFATLLTLSTDHVLACLHAASEQGAFKNDPE